MTRIEKMERLPVPEWSRPGETWRVEPETAVTWAVGVSGECRSPRSCGRPAVAGFTSRGGYDYPVCVDHLRESRMWIEDGRVVSWKLVAAAEYTDTLDVACEKCGATYTASETHHCAETHQEKQWRLRAQEKGEL